MAGLLGYARWALILCLAVGYAVLAHYTNSRPRTEALGTVVATAPLLLAALSMAWHASHRKTMLALFGVGCAALVAARADLERHVGLIYWIEHAGTELILCLVFARTLRAGREPMCTYFARMVHGAVSPGLAHYTRGLTRVWAIFFGVMSATSAVLFITAPIAAWSVFANFFTGPLIGLMFVVEYAVRRRMLPDAEHAHILDGIKAFWKQPAR